MSRLVPVLGWVILVLAAGVAGCAGTYSYTTTATLSIPPAPQDELVPPAPGPAFVWVNGYWWWDSVEWVWVPGRWAAPPGPAYVWMRSGWVDEGGRYVFVHGRWVLPGRQPSFVYVHPASRVRVQAGASYRATPRGSATVRARVR